MEELLCDGCKGAHESMTRAFHIVVAVKRYLKLGTPPEVVLEIIEEMEGKDV